MIPEKSRQWIALAVAAGLTLACVAAGLVANSAGSAGADRDLPEGGPALPAAFPAPPLRDHTFRVRGRDGTVENLTADEYAEQVVRQRGDRPGSPIGNTVEAEILPPGFSGNSTTSLMWPVLNGWQVSDHRHFTAVYAGGDGAGGRSNSMGRFYIYRQNYLQLTEEVELVDVPGAGPVKITRAPLGEDIGTRAQARGKLRFKSRRGVTGTLLLATDTVELDP